MPHRNYFRHILVISKKTKMCILYISHCSWIIFTTYKGKVPVRTASSPPSYSGQFPEVSLRLSSSVMMMFSMSFIVRWSRKAWNSTCFSSSRDSCCMSNCRGTRRSMQRDTVIHKRASWGQINVEVKNEGLKCTEILWHEQICVLFPKGL